MDAKIAKNKIDQWFERIRNGYKIFAPVRREGIVRYSQVERFDEIDSEALATTMSAKDVVYPQWRAIFRFTEADDTWQIESIDGEPEYRLLFGVRPCDAQALKVLDRNFIREDFTDARYEASRAKTAIVAIACSKPLTTCFCSAVGGSPVDTDMADIVLTDVGDSYYAVSKTADGEELIKMAGDIFVDAEDADRDEVAKRHQECQAEIGQRFDYQDLAKKLEGAFDDPYWRHASEKCLNCGYCTYTCPTCYCFNVTDEKHPDGTSERLASWDSCMFYGFTRMAGGHNPRNERYRRYRQRVLHKFKYFVDLHGFAACVGCGRCIQACPVEMDISKIVEGAAKSSEH